ncbi:hypothetical protein FHS16_002578 [Paenibacillus endophyticus]|uniref:Uncharacterized protein n=1 Tax=Paenibacillus endophyticus TaxID=1294268 RepID=A0A7W5GAP7_9BACL|nr:hypothetical protein [Paenibacillus endophyticus]MBB3152528.1 hypothetical protein [Paenibacillus endophyticus]
MSALMGVLVFSACVAWLELPKLKEKKQKKEMAVFVAMLLLGTGLYGALVMNAKLPNPFLLLKAVYGMFA